MAARNSMHRAGRKRVLPAAPVLLIAFAIAGLAGVVLLMELTREPDTGATAEPAAIANATTADSTVAQSSSTDEAATPAPDGDEPAEPASQPKAQQDKAPKDKPQQADHEPYLVPAGRSPLPQPGETFSEPIPAKKLAEIELTSLKPVAPAPEPGEVVPWTEAKLHIGREITVGGQIIDTHMHDSGNLCFLNFEVYPSKAFYLVAFKPTFGNFPESPEKYFLNQHVEVTGKPVFHRDRVQIQIHDADQIKRVPAPEAEPDPDEQADASEV